MASKKQAKALKGNPKSEYIGDHFPRIAKRAVFYESIEALNLDEQVDAMRRRNAAMRAHPDYAAKARIEQALVGAHLDPLLLGAPELSRFVFIMRELLHESEPGDTLPEILQPLHTLLSRRGGGRRPVTTQWQEWSDRFDKLKMVRRQATTRELYEDIAAEVSKRLKEPVPWTRIRDGISKLKKAKTVDQNVV